MPQLADVNTDSQDKGIQTSLTIDRDAAARLGVTTRTVDATLNDLFGQRQVSTIYTALNQYRVVMEAAPAYWQSPESLDQVYVSAADGTQVPLSAFASYGPTSTPLAVNHQGQFVASTISFNLPRGRIAGRGHPRDLRTRCCASACRPRSRAASRGPRARSQASLDSQPWLILAALLAVYIVLGMLYESLIHPLTILSTLPSAGVGALLALLAVRHGVQHHRADRRDPADRHRQEERHHDDRLRAGGRAPAGMAPEQAIYQACLLRFRPIMMTTMAALLGALPLAIGFGDGAELRRPLGIAIVGGLIVSQMLTLYTTPVVYLYLDRFGLWCKCGFRRAEGRRSSPAHRTVTEQP